MCLEYLVKPPKEIKEKNGALLLIHGYGSNEEDLFSFAPQLSEDIYVISIRAPYNLQPYGYAWYEITFDADENKFSNNEQAKESLQLIANFIDEISEKLPLDKSNISLIGFSQGAILSYGMAFTYPEKINKVVALSGYLNEQILPENYDLNQINHIDFFASHGTQDQVIPVEWARKTAPYLEKLCLRIVYKEYPVGHGVAPQNFWDFKNWLD
jgi:phospholipase/carboxylesterase